jgi:LEA14-like dessication related protein
MNWNKFRLPVIIAVTLFSAYLLYGCSAFQALEYRGLTDWDAKPKSLAETKLSAVVQIYNPNKYKITVKRIEADIDVNGSIWSKYKSDSVFQVPAQSEFAFPIDMTVKNSYLLTGAYKLVTAGTLPYKLTGKIKGTYRNITAEVPFLHNGKFTEEDFKF